MCAYPAADNPTTLELLVDDGNGVWVAFDPPGVRPVGVAAVPSGAWHVASFQRALLSEGLVRKQKLLSRGNVLANDHLPRQARDKHTENPTKTRRCL